MRSFKIPFDVSNEEKIFKGILSFRQMGYMSLNLISIAILFINIPLFIRIIFFLTIVTIVSLFAFYQIDGIYFDKYVVYFLKYLKKDKKYIYKK